MRALLLALLPAVLLPACLCGAFEGAGDVMYRRGGDSLFLCTNGGYAGTIGTAMIEGRFRAAGTIEADTGETGARAFTLAQTTTPGEWASPELGTGWATATLDKTELDHAHVQCNDLEIRAWWPTTNLPSAIGFAKTVDQFATVEACHTAQASGTYPTTAACEDELLLCTDGSLQLRANGAIDAGTYSNDVGTITVVPTTAATFQAVFAADKLTTPTDTVWTKRAVDQLSAGMRCR